MTDQPKFNGRLWTEYSSEELMDVLTAIDWGLKEHVHAIARRRKDVLYVIPAIPSETVFQRDIRAGMEGARETIQKILTERGLSEIPVRSVTIITEEEFRLLDLGWEKFRNMYRDAREIMEKQRAAKVLSRGVSEK